MANILVIDDQKWVLDLCEQGLAEEEHHIMATDDTGSVRRNILSFKPDIVLLNFYLKYGALVWDVLDDIKKQAPNLPVLIVATSGTSLLSPRLSKADGYLIRSHTAPDDLRRKISALITA